MAILFLLLIALTFFFLPPAGLVWPTQPTTGINLYAETDNVKRKIGIPVIFFRKESGKKMVNIRKTLILS